MVWLCEILTLTNTLGLLTNNIIVNITPENKGFLALKVESISAGFNLLRTLDENWLSGQKRFDKAGENLLGFYADGILVGDGTLSQVLP
jgi:hypothetical protein